MKSLSEKRTSKTLWMLFCGLLMLAGCEIYGPRPLGPPVIIDAPPGEIVTPPVDPSVWFGAISITAYAPPVTSLTPNTQSVMVTVREGGAYGPVLVQPTEFDLEANGTLAVDVLDVPYGYYDIEIVGLDLFGNNVSYAATGITLDEPIVSVSLDLDPITFVGAVRLDIVEPADDGFTGPAYSLDYILWERDVVTGELTFVEEITEIELDGWTMPVIEHLELGEYTIEAFGFDAYGNLIYEYVVDFSHDTEETMVPIFFWYSL